jgi:CRP-like cAMP-binding protein
VLGVDKADAQRAVLLDLCQAMELETFPANAVVMEQGTPGNVCYVVVCGSCDVYRLSNPAQPSVKEHTMFVREPQCAGEPADDEGLTFTHLLSKVMNLSKAADRARASGGVKVKSPPKPIAASVLGSPGGRTLSLVTTPSRRKKTFDDGSVKRLGACISSEKHPKFFGEAGGDENLTGPVIVPVFERNCYGELIASAEEGDVIGELALFNSSTIRAATVISNGHLTSPSKPTLRSRKSSAKGGIELEDTVLVKITKDGSWCCMIHDEPLPVGVHR